MKSDFAVKGNVVEFGFADKDMPTPVIREGRSRVQVETPKSIKFYDILYHAFEQKYVVPSVIRMVTIKEDGKDVATITSGDRNTKTPHLNYVNIRSHNGNMENAAFLAEHLKLMPDVGYCQDIRMWPKDS